METNEKPITLDYAPRGRRRFSTHRNAHSLIIRIKRPRQEHQIAVTVTMCLLIPITLGLPVWLAPILGPYSIVLLFLALVGEICTAALINLLPSEITVTITGDELTVRGADNPHGQPARKTLTVPRLKVYDVRYSTMANRLIIRAHGADMIQINVEWGEETANLIGEIIRRELGLPS